MEIAFPRLEMLSDQINAFLDLLSLDIEGNLPIGASSDQTIYISASVDKLSGKVGTDKTADSGY